jgi:hypothetical protein
MAINVLANSAHAATRESILRFIQISRRDATAFSLSSGIGSSTRVSRKSFSGNSGKGWRAGAPLE